jgi:hypothetical protein
MSDVNVLIPDSASRSRLRFPNVPIRFEARLDETPSCVSRAFMHKCTRQTRVSHAFTCFHSRLGSKAFRIIYIVFTSFAEMKLM